MPGICTLIDMYLDKQDISETTRHILKSQVHLVRQRATGERITNAKWMREFVRNHPKYKHDSVVDHDINYDLMQAIIHLDSEELLVQ